MSEQLRYLTQVAAAARVRRLECSERSNAIRSAWVYAAGEIDLVTAPELDAVLRRVESQERLVVLDLRDVSFVDCSGLHVIGRWSRSRTDERWMVVVVNPGSQIQRLLQITGIAVRFDVLASFGAALIRAAPALSERGFKPPGRPLRSSHLALTQTDNLIPEVARPESGRGSVLSMSCPRWAKQAELGTVTNVFGKATTSAR